tara:strand:- start:7584 stop:7973 length:390 start_codon:yes stop_codon:yes gene_type:complete
MFQHVCHNHHIEEIVWKIRIHQLTECHFNTFGRSERCRLLGDLHAIDLEAPLAIPRGSFAAAAAHIEKSLARRGRDNHIEESSRQEGAKGTPSISTHDFERDAPDTFLGRWTVTWCLMCVIRRTVVLRD